MLRLSARDRQLCEMLCRGYEQREMASELGLSTRTVKCYFQRIYARNDIRRGVRRVRLAVRFYREKMDDTHRT